MKKLFAAFAAVCVAGSALPAQAGQCPADMRKIDAALPGASLSAAELAMVKELRKKGEALHKSGGHGASVQTLAKAKKVLGIG